MEETHVVTVFLRNRGEVLLLRRSEAVSSYAGQWGTVAGHVEDEDPDETARREISEETGIDDATLVRRGDPSPVADDFLDTRWVVHPHLFDTPTRAVEKNWETDEFAWVPPTEILRRETVPDLWQSYDRVAPTVETVAGDREHGSVYVSLRALEVLRDRAAVLDERGSDDSDAWAELAGVAKNLLAARPSMAVLANRVNRAMAAASDERTPAAVERAATEGIERALAADETAARRAAEVVAGKRVLTLSRSGTVLDALCSADPEPSVLVAESRPAREGVGVAEDLADAGLDVTLCTDAAVAHLVAEESVEAVLVGADAILPDGSVVNKVGTRAAALAADREEIAFYAVAATDKVALDESFSNEEGSRDDIYDGKRRVNVTNPIFDVSAADIVDGIVNEDGVKRNEDVGETVEELRELTSWNG
jgi:translation initiation factor 2B subunit (eIF-2B alpha/beta/delta family)/ADP-ribose pyrophosphatase YjhB (NUDIX family)